MTVAEYLFSGWVTRLGVAEPDVRVALEMGNFADVAAVLADEVDRGVEGATVPRDLATRAVCTGRLAVVVARPGPAVVSELAIDRDVAAGRLAVVAGADLHTERTIRAGWRRGRRPSAPAAALVRIATAGRRVGATG